ncbi:long-chain fatty acid--CoA ligase [Nocardia sp. NPDC004604]|uniref:AMP-dependent synthetase/ligase n=1 Tax=Nocardia sp. NPDC004604 TaxID=3157013 RepID=UPI0033A66E38
MPESTAIERIREADSFCELFQATAAARADQIALRTSDGAVSITWREYARRVRRIGAGLAALGVSHGDIVAIMLTNRPEFHLVDTATYHLGATPFSIYNTSSIEQIGYLFTNAENTVVVCEAQFFPKVLEARRDGKVQHVVCVDGDGDEIISLAELESAGRPDFDFEAAWRAVRPDDLLALIYTSGTTGPPKGVELTHRALLYFTEAVFAIPEFAAGAFGGRLVSYLPDAHALNRWFGQYAASAAGATVTTVANSGELIDVLPTVRPTLFLAVPMLWYKLQAAVENAVAAEKFPRRSIASWALDVGRRGAAHRLAGTVPPLHERLRQLIADRLVLSGLAAKLGLDRVTLALTGAAPIAPESLEFVLGLGIPCCEGWGMSEILVTTINPPGAIRPGTVGTPLRDVEIRQAEDGELLVRTPGVMRGYRNDPVRTTETIDADGWVHTGDIGSLDADGYVTIVDRKKELIINSAGKNMSPANIENAVKTACSMIGCVAAIGDRRKYVTALVTLDPDAGATFARERGLADGSAARLAEHPEVRRLIDEAVARANAKLSRVEQIKKFTILPVYWEPGGDEVTPTLKLQRGRISAKYANEIDALYTTKEGA